MNIRPNKTTLSPAPTGSPRAQAIQSQIDQSLPASSHDVHVPLISSIAHDDSGRQRIWLTTRDRETAWREAQRLAKQASREIQRVDLSGVVSKYLRETEKNLLKIFDTAKESGAILFFDEADALFGKRTSLNDAHDRYAGLERPYLLQLIENYPGSVILASSDPSTIDRRLLEKYSFVERTVPVPPKIS